MDIFEKRMLLGYYYNCLSNHSIFKKKLNRIFDWHIEHGHTIFPFKWELTEMEKEDTFLDYSDLCLETRKKIAKQEKDFLHTISKKIPQKEVKNISKIEKFLIILKNVLNLSQTEFLLLGVITRYKLYAEFSEFFSNIFDQHELTIENIHIIAGLPKNSLDKYFSHNAKLIKNGIVSLDYDGEITLTKFTSKMLQENITSEFDLQRYVIGDVQQASLVWEDFNHISEKELCYKIVKNAVDNHYQGINILLYGEPGTGKTEFTKTLCDKIGINLFAIGEKFEENNRANCLEFSQKMIHEKDKVVFLIDEADDIFHNEKKFYINRMLETNITPRIWILNYIDLLDKAYLRRFSYAIKFEKPSLSVRANMWKKEMQKAKIMCDDQKALDFATRYNLSPSFINSAVKSAKIAKGGINEIITCLDTLEQAYNDGEIVKKHTQVEEMNFNLNLLNTDTDLERLTMQLVNLKKQDFSLCLYGVSGTGKSAYAEYLAKQLGINIVKKRCSDLIDKFVGETEKNIANAFLEAKEKEAMLVFDEADSFLMDRNFAIRNFEISAVNEMLTQMENHTFPFICTTNIIDKMDKASLRRFTFKVNYQFMKKEQVQLAFKFFFNFNDIDSTPFNFLSPADFVVTKKKAEILGCIEDKKEIIKFLLQEQEIKQEEKTYKMGFM